MVKEQFINTSSWELSIYLIEKKPQSFRKLAAIAKQYLTFYNKKQSSSDFSSKKILCSPKPKIKNSDTFYGTTEGIKCFHCGILGSRTSKCFSRVQDKGKINSCDHCAEICQTFKQCEKRN